MHLRPAAFKNINKMTREIYLSKMKDVSTEIEILNTLKRELSSDYLKINSLYNFGEKVTINRKDGSIEGFIGKSKIDRNGFICYDIHSVKKDGTMSSRCLFYYFEFKNLQISKIK